MRIEILTGKEFHDTINGKETRFEVIEEGPFQGGETNYKSRYVILKEKKTGDTFMGFEACQRETDDIWSQVQNKPDERYTMKQCQKMGNIGWVEMEPER